MSYLYLGKGNLVNRYEDPGTSAPETHDWSFDHGASVYAVAVDNNGYVYLGGARVDSVTHRKLDADGNEIWTADHGGTVNDIAADASGNVYIVGAAVSNVSFRKYNSSGSEQWSKELTVEFHRVVVADDGYIYVSGATTSSVNVRRYNPDGTQPTPANWGMPTSSTIIQYGLAVRDGYIYTGHNQVSSKTHRKYDTNGSVEWAKDHGNTVRAVAVNGDGTVWIAGAASSNVALRQYDNEGTEQWTYNDGGGIHDIRLDSSDNIFVSTQYGYLKKIDSAGDEVWTYEAFGICSALAILENIPQSYTAPALPLGVYCGLPESLRAFDAPALPLAFAVAVASRDGGTSWIFRDAPALALALSRGIPALELEYIGGGQVYYQTQLGDLVLPTRLTQIRKTAEGVTLTLTCPVNSATWRAAIASRAGELLGVRWVQRLPNGAELSDYSAQAPLTSVRQSPGEIQLSAAGPRVSLTQRTRIATGIEYRNLLNGRSRIRCTPDRYLEPGDWLQLPGGASILAGEVVYTLEPGRGVMEVSE